MSDNAAELLIKIRTALEAGGIDAAKQKLNELTGTTKEAAVANAGHAVEVGKVAEKMRTLSQASRGLHGLLSGTLWGTVSGLRHLFVALGATITGVAASAFVGWKVGTLIFDKFVDSVRGLGPIAEKSFEELKKVDDVKLEAVSKAVNDLTQNLSTAVNRIERLASLKKELEQGAAGTEQGRLKKELAGISEEDPEKKLEVEKKLAASVLHEKQNAANIDLKAANDKKKELQTALDGLNKQIEKLDPDVKDRENAVKRAIETKDTDPAALRLLRRQADLARSGLEPKRKELLGQKADLELQITEQEGKASSAMAQVDIGSLDQDTTVKSATREASKKRKALDDIRKKQSQEAALQKLEQEREDEGRYYEERKNNAEGALSDAKDTAASAHSVAKAFDPSKNRYSNSRQRSAAESRDRGFDVTAMGADARVKELEQALKSMEADYKRTVDAITETAKHMRESNKNLPIH